MSNVATMTTPNKQHVAGVSIDPVTSAEDFPPIMHCISEAFGRQARDAAWIVLNPRWETPQGQQEGANQLRKRWESIKTDKEGRPNTIFLKATFPDSENDTKRKIAGMAIWQQASFVDGYGDPPSDDLGDALKLIDPTEARFASQMFRSFWKRRIEVAKEKAHSEPPAIFVLDMCCVDPGYQRRGIAGKLVQWGLDEAKRRGNLECTTEASSMGRGAYIKLGFLPEGNGADILYEIDEEFRSRDKPPNVFLRTGSTT
jgi:GNAT superfamily N-acetyltransferase